MAADPVRAMVRRPVFRGLLFATVVVFCAPPAFAEGRDHDRARRALEAGEVLPLPRILAALERDYPGQVMEVELEREDGRWVYEIKLLQRGGRMLKLDVDASDARVLELDGHGGRDGRREGRSR